MAHALPTAMHLVAELLARLAPKVLGEADKSMDYRPLVGQDGDKPPIIVSAPPECTGLHMHTHTVH
jgi:hypothetical protein